MIATLRRVSGALAVALAMGAAPASAAPAATGVWIDHTGRGAVEITDCGGKLCGRIVWLKDTGHKSACGLQVIGDVKPMSGGRWDGGWILDPEKDTKYDVELTPIDDKRLKVLGYTGIKFLSETMIWTRAPASLARCGEATAAAPDAAQPPKRAEPPASAPPRADTPPPAPRAEAPRTEKSEPPKAGRSEPPKAGRSEPPKAEKSELPKAEKKSKTARGGARDCTLTFGGVSITFPCPD